MATGDPGVTNYEECLNRPEREYRTLSGSDGDNPSVELPTASAW